MQYLMLRSTLRAHTAGTHATNRIKAGLAQRLDYRDERGDVTPRTVGIAVMSAAAVGVGVAITQKITDKEASITLD